VNSSKTVALSSGIHRTGTHAHDKLGRTVMSDIEKKRDTDATLLAYTVACDTVRTTQTHTQRQRDRETDRDIQSIKTH